MTRKTIRRDLGHNVPEDDTNIQTAQDRREEREASDYQAMIAAYRTGRAAAEYHARHNELVANEHLNAMARDSYGYDTDDERDAFAAGYRHAASDARLKEGLALLAPRREPNEKTPLLRRP